MENRRDSPILVWVSNNQAYLAVDAIALRFSGASVYLDILRKGKAIIRKHVTLPETRNYEEFCFMVNKISKDE